jgi:hypothetical protein
MVIKVLAKPPPAEKPTPAYGALTISGCLEVTLRDGTWYRGSGRNARVGLWDARAHCFWTIALNDFADPAKFPAQPLRQVRLKREDYFSESSGSFRPATAI